MTTRLKEMREEKGLTQAQVAEKAIVTIRVYQRYESGERTPSVVTAQRIAIALCCKVEDIFPSPSEYIA